MLSTFRIRHGLTGRAAFTLTELLVVILIIALLISILVPVVGRVRTSAWEANTRAQVASLVAAIDQYHSDHRAYPGVFSNLQLWSTNPTGVNGGTTIDVVTPVPAGYTLPATIDLIEITAAENLVLSLLGGVRIDDGGTSTDRSDDIEVYDPTLVGLGARSLNAVSPKNYRAYMEKADLSFRVDEASSLTTGFFKDSRNQFAVGLSRVDTPIPEFVDRFPNNPLPILYYRANVGASGIISDVGATASARRQYDLEPNFAYVGSQIGVNVDQAWPDQHGLQDAGNIVDGSNNVLKVIDQAQWSPIGPGFNAAIYFRNPQTGGTLNTTGTPRQKDGYILISAGKDRVYGTLDDITNFGSID